MTVQPKKRGRGRPRQEVRSRGFLAESAEDVRETLKVRAKTEGMSQTDLLINLILTNQV